MIKKKGYLELFLFGCLMQFIFVQAIGYDPGAELAILFIFPFHIILNAIAPIIFVILSEKFSSFKKFYISAIFIFFLNLGFMNIVRQRTTADYNIDTNGIVENYIKTDNNLKKILVLEFKNNLYSKLQCHLAPHKVKEVYNSNRTKATNSVSDTIIEYTIDNIALNQKKEKAIYFITYLVFLNIHANDSLPARLEKYQMYTAAVAVELDKNYKWKAQNVAIDNPDDFSYQKMKIDETDKIIINARQDCLKWLLVDYDFYLFWKIKNNSFWDKIMERQQGYDMKEC